MSFNLYGFNFPPQIADPQLIENALMGLLIYKYEPFLQEVKVDCLSLGWMTIKAHGSLGISYTFQKLFDRKKCFYLYDFRFGGFFSFHIKYFSKFLYRKGEHIGNKFTYLLHCLIHMYLQFLLVRKIMSVFFFAG